MIGPIPVDLEGFRITMATLSDFSKILLAPALQVPPSTYMCDFVKIRWETTTELERAVTKITAFIVWLAIIAILLFNTVLSVYMWLRATVADDGGHVSLYGVSLSPPKWQWVKDLFSVHELGLGKA